MRLLERLLEDALTFREAVSKQRVREIVEEEIKRILEDESQVDYAIWDWMDELCLPEEQEEEWGEEFVEGSPDDNPYAYAYQHAVQSVTDYILQTGIADGDGTEQDVRLEAARQALSALLDYTHKWFMDRAQQLNRCHVSQAAAADPAVQAWASALQQIHDWRLGYAPQEGMPGYKQPGQNPVCAIGWWKRLVPYAKKFLDGSWQQELTPEQVDQVLSTQTTADWLEVTEGNAQMILDWAEYCFTPSLKGYIYRAAYDTLQSIEAQGEEAFRDMAYRYLVALLPEGVASAVADLLKGVLHIMFNNHFHTLVEQAVHQYGDTEATPQQASQVAQQVVQQIVNADYQTLQNYLASNQWISLPSIAQLLQGYQGQLPLTTPTVGELSGRS